MKTLLRLFAATFFTLVLCTVTQAIPRTWVSSTGNDVNPCTRTSPCATFGGALTKTDASGEINAIDPGDYAGNFAIAKAVTIDGGAGQVASILRSSFTAIIVNAAAADTVIIRNISITGQDTGDTGIQYIGGGQLVLENVTIEKFAGKAIFVRGTAGNPLQLEANHCRLFGNLVGIEQQDHSFVALRDSVITGTLHKGQTSFGINVRPNPGTAASTKLENNEISFTNSAVRAVSTDLGSGPVDLWLRANHIYKNIVGANFSNAVQYHSDGSNRLSDNQIPISGGTSAGFLSF